MEEYLIGDHHFDHKGIIKFERAEFKTIEEHNEFIVKAHNETVNDEDIVYFLGDLGSDDCIMQIVPQMKGHKILIKGNHDIYPNEFYYGVGFKEVHNHPVFYNDFLILSHEPQPVEGGYYLNAHAHIHCSSINGSKAHICLSAKKIGYKPVKINDVISKNKEGLIPIKARFLHEWYADRYVFEEGRPDVVLDESGLIMLTESRMLENK